MKFDYRNGLLSFKGKKYSIDEINKELIEKSYYIVSRHFTTLKSTNKGLKLYVDWKYVHSLPEIQIIILKYLNGKDRNHQGQDERTQ